MSRQFRYRVTAIVLGGLIFGAPLLTGGPASAGQLGDDARAEQRGEGGRQVVFEGGGMLGFSCRSRPDVESMVVPAESTVRVVNRTGYSAKLMLSGDTKGMLPDDAATEVVFRRGTTEVLLQPNCALGDDATPVMVTASPSAAATMPDPIPAPAGNDDAPPSAAAPAAAERPSGPASGSTLPDTAMAARPNTNNSPTGTAGTRGPNGLRTPVVAQAATTAAQAMPQGEGASTVDVRTSRTASGAVPEFAGMPPGDRKAILPGVPSVDGAPANPGAAPAAATPPPTEIAAAEPVATMQPMPDTAPIGMLALIAAVCVMGVGAATIRAIVSQRANGAKIA